MAQGYDHLLMIAGGVAVSMRDCFLPCSALFCAVLPCSALFCLVCPCLFLSHLSSCSVPRSPPPPLERSHTPHDLVSTITTHVSMQLACAHLMPHTPPLTPPTPFPPLPTYTNIRGLAVNPRTFMYAASPNTPPLPPHWQRDPQTCIETRSCLQFTSSSESPQGKARERGLGSGTLS